MVDDSSARFLPTFITRSRVGGTSLGAGLAICRAAVEGLTWTIEVSNAGRDARFVVSFLICTAGEAVSVSA